VDRMVGIVCHQVGGPAVKHRAPPRCHEDCPADNWARCLLPAGRVYYRAL
jgi:hypothetical protein